MNRARSASSWCGVDCNTNTAPGMPSKASLEQCAKRGETAQAYLTPDDELYAVHNSVWTAAGMKPFGGCLKLRLGRRLGPEDFDRSSPLENTILCTYGSPRPLDRRRPWPRSMFRRF
jgi:hypothetical protein